jgi:Xaa-Pro aminopeptidase
MASARIERLRSSLALNKLDLLLVTYLPNIRYLTGFSDTSGVLLVGDGQSQFFTDGRYKEQAHAEVHGAGVAIRRKAPLLAAAEWLSRRRRREKTVVGIEASHLSVEDRDRLAAVLATRFRIESAPPLIEQQRMVKDPHEIGLIHQAVLLGSQLFDRLLKSIRPGVKESAIAAELEYAARQAGCEAMSFPTIIASGPRSALPHGRASDQRLPRRGFVVSDFGVILGGYCSDMTRTVYVGQPDQEARSFYQAVRDAQLAGVEAARPGVPSGEVDRAARKVLRKAGWGRYFTHSTGHGLGLEIHEAPRVASGQSEILRPGMVITIEPGAYVPRKWGVRVEDVVVVTEQGAKVLTPTTRELICV